ncbi:MAG: RICIN domain-containing protein [Bacteroidota bacterium]
MNLFYKSLFSALALMLCSISLSAQSKSSPFNPDSYYRLTTQFTGEGKSLDIINDAKDNKLEMRTTGKKTGQYWKITSVGNGYYRLTTQFTGEGKSLDIINDDKDNKLEMRTTGRKTGQYWKITSVGNGYYRLTTQFTGEGKSLDIINDDKDNKLEMRTTGRKTGQYWRITEIKTDSTAVAGGGSTVKKRKEKKPIAHWKFTGSNPLKDLAGNFGTLELKGGAKVDSEGLKVGKGSYARATGSLKAPLTKKTLVVIAKIDDLNVRGGSLLTIDKTKTDEFDGIVFAEKKAQQLMAGSSFYRRTKDFKYPSWATVQANDWMAIAITYGTKKGKAQVKIYMGNSTVGTYNIDALPSYKNDLEILFGTRHTRGQSPTGFLAGHIKEAWLFKGTLNGKQINALGYETPLYDKMISGNVLKEGEQLITADGNVRLAMQYDGNLAMYKGLQWVWDAKTALKGKYVTMQSDGNFVIYDDKKEAHWSSKTHPYHNSKYRNSKYKPVELNLLPDATFKLVNSPGETMWLAPRDDK